MRILAVCCSLILALPPPWCCGLCPLLRCSSNAARHHNCCEHTAVQQELPAPCGCCCGGEEATAEKGREGTTPQRSQPLDPPAKCCCHPQPVTVPPQPLPLLTTDGDVATLATNLDFQPGRLRSGSLVVSAPSRTDPPLHVLHCLWLC